MPGKLLIVATPLGNAGDASPRMREVLAGADVILAEDTRRAGLLFQRLGIKGPGFVSFHEHNEGARQAQVLERLAQGQTVALISDAGTPLISDPGYLLVRAARQAGHTVSPVPGPSAVTAALSAAGLPPLPFVFLGFLPRKAGRVAELLAPYAALPATLVLFERKSRVAESLAVAGRVLGEERECCLARELTKPYEEFIVGRLGELARSLAGEPEFRDAGDENEQDAQGEDDSCAPETGPLEFHGEFHGELRGELTVVIGPPAAAATPDAETVRAIAAEERTRGGKPREIARRTAARAPGWSVSEVYALLTDPEP